MIVLWLKWVCLHWKCLSKNVGKYHVLWFLRFKTHAMCTVRHAIMALFCIKFETVGKWIIIKNYSYFLCLKSSKSERCTNNVKSHRYVFLCTIAIYVAEQESCFGFEDLLALNCMKDFSGVFNLLGKF